MGRLTGKTAVITGGNSGIGLATAKRFVSEGAYLFITGRRQDELDKAIATLGSGVTGVQGDISNLDDLDRLFATVQAEKGQVDVLFANAGIGGRGPLGAISEEQFDKVFFLM
jgi:NAD(P)-dependent dehydrogenase (short-subunit alcohol dehydrogenase family)